MPYNEIVSITNSVINGHVPIADGNGSYEWGLMHALNPIHVTVQISDWDENEATVDAAVSPNNSVLYAADPNSSMIVADCHVAIASCGNGTITFTAEQTPTSAITFSIIVI